MTRVTRIDYTNGHAIVAVDDGRVALVDINNLDATPVEDVDAIVASGQFLRVAPDFEVPSPWIELSEAVLASLGVEEEKKPEERKFRVPHAVRTEARQGRDWANGFERAQTPAALSIAEELINSTYLSFSRVQRIARYFGRRPQSITDNAGWTPGTMGFPTDERIKYSMWGGEAAREWVNKIDKKHPLLAAADVGMPPLPPEHEIAAEVAEAPATDGDGDVDPNAPHVFVEDPELAGECAVCGGERDDDVHVDDEAEETEAGETELDPAATYYGKGVDPDSTYVTELIGQIADDDDWQMFDGTGWTPIEAPGEDAVIIMLDMESAEKLAAFIKNRDPENQSEGLELSTLVPHEAALFNAADAEIDWSLVDAVFDIYDSTERSVNAKKQVRGPGGRFGDQQGDGESTKQTNAQTKARLPQAMPLVEDVKSLIDQYLNSVARQRNEGGTVPAAQPEMSSLEQFVKNEYRARIIDRYAGTTLGQAELAGGDPGTVTDVRPLYLAIVDSVDTEAVLDVISLVPPAAGTQGQPTVWKRDAGTWKAAPDLLADLQGVTPPPVVELSDDTVLKQVLDQVDQATTDSEPVKEEAPAESPEPIKPDANPDQHPIVAAGHDLIFLENRRTPKIVPEGKKYEPKPSEGKIVRRRKANAEEEKTIRSGGWVRVSEKGKTPKDSDYKSSKKSKIRPQNNSILGLDALVDELIDMTSPEHDDHTRLAAAKTLLEYGYEPTSPEFGNKSADKRDKLAKKGYALPDGSFPIETVGDLKNAISAFGRAKNKDLAKQHIKKRARALNRADLIPDSWGTESENSSQAMWGPHGEIVNLVAAGEGGLDRNRGNAERLRDYWEHGEGAAKIVWNTPGDWYRCVSHLSKYLGNRAKGYCTLRHRAVTGAWPGQEGGGDKH